MNHIMYMYIRNKSCIFMSGLTLVGPAPFLMCCSRSLRAWVTAVAAPPRSARSLSSRQDCRAASTIPSTECATPLAASISCSWQAGLLMVGATTYRNKRTYQISWYKININQSDHFLQEYSQFCFYGNWANTIPFAERRTNVLIIYIDRHS